MRRIRYREGYKYQLAEDYTIMVAIYPPVPIITPFIELHPSGRLEIRAGYAWDGASGPAIDTKNFLRGSLVHDAIYEMFALHGLDRKAWRKAADQELVRICAEDGMSWVRRQWVYAAVRAFGRGTRREQPKVISAP